MKASSEKPPLTRSWVTQLSYGMMRYDPETSAANFATSCVACYLLSRAYMKGRKSFPSRQTFGACWPPLRAPAFPAGPHGPPGPSLSLTASAPPSAPPGQRPGRRKPHKPRGR